MSGALGLAVAAGLAAGCAGHMSPPAEGGGPLPGREGVTLAVSRQSCQRVETAGPPPSRALEVIVELRVQNDAGASIEMFPEAIRLSAPGGVAFDRSRWGATEPIRVSSGDTDRIEIRFLNRGDLTCATSLRLDTAGSIVLLGRPLATDSIAFKPRLTVQ